MQGTVLLRRVNSRDASILGWPTGNLEGYGPDMCLTLCLDMSECYFRSQLRDGVNCLGSTYSAPPSLHAAIMLISFEHGDRTMSRSYTVFLAIRHCLVVVYLHRNATVQFTSQIEFNRPIVLFRSALLEQPHDWPLIINLPDRVKQLVIVEPGCPSRPCRRTKSKIDCL